MRHESKLDLLSSTCNVGLDLHFWLDKSKIQIMSIDSE